MSLASLIKKLRCYFKIHQWIPYDIQVWIIPDQKIAGYQDAKCRDCDVKRGQATNFHISDVPSEQVFGSSSPYQITEDGVIWYTAEYWNLFHPIK